MMRGMDMAEVIRRRRAELGLSQADLAKAAGVDTRQIRRYEAGQQQPVLSVAVAIAKALGISVSELAGAPSHRVDLTGDWWTCWQTSRGGVEDIRTQPVHLDQHGELIQIEATARGRPVEEGGYLWRGELRLWDTPACTLVVAMVWPKTSWSSRAMRNRSSTARRRACSSRVWVSRASWARVATSTAR